MLNHLVGIFSYRISSFRNDAGEYVSWLDQLLIDRRFSFFDDIHNLRIQ